MNVRLKLYAMLAKYLPSGAEKNEATVEAAEGASVLDVLSARGLPEEHCHLVLVNGVYVAPGERASRALEDGDHVAVWPPVAGGNGAGGNGAGG